VGVGVYIRMYGILYDVVDFNIYDIYKRHVFKPFCIIFFLLRCDYFIKKKL